MERPLSFGAVLVAGAGVAALAALQRRPRRRPPPFPLVRVAGLREMRHPPAGWDDVDEAADASFPASDPPGKY
ncbi:MAG: hypothetical protein AB7M12_13100 [Hyphomonadaceae bacterium]